MIHQLVDLRFKEDGEVFDKQGNKVGEIDRVVFDPRTKDITHVVVRKGFLFTEDKVVPVEWFELATDEKAILNISKEKVDSLPTFEETHYRPAYSKEDFPPEMSGYARPYYWYPASGVYWWGYPGYGRYFGFSKPPAIKTVERHIPEGTVPLEEGADVISADNDHVGQVEEIMADPDSDHATHFVISKGLFFKEKKLIPTAWIQTIDEDKVYLSVDSNFLDQLEPYKG